MKIKDWSRKFLWFTLGAGTVSLLSFVITSGAQQDRFVKLIMRFGEERVLEDGTKVGVNKGEGDLIVVTLSRPTSNQSSETSVSSGSTGTLVGACGVSIGKIIADKWLQAGGGAGILGCPYSGEVSADKSTQGTTGRYVEFKGDGLHGPGAIYWHRTGQYSGRAFIVRGGILQLYKDMGRSSSWLGFPISDQYDVPNGARSNFEGGYIFWNQWTGYSQAFKYN